MSEVPLGWQERSLREAAQWFSGGTPSTSESRFWNGPIPWITSGSLTSFRLRSSSRTLTEEGLENGSRLVPAGTTLIVVRGMSLKTEVRLGIAQRPLAFGQDCKALVPADDLDPLFFAYALAARRSQLLELVDEAGHGTGRLNTDQLEAVQIGIPPAKEQHRIVEALEAMDDKIELSRRQITTILELSHTIYERALAGDSLSDKMVVAAL